jgi:oligopeptide transport system substrate-binding protein
MVKQAFALVCQLALVCATIASCVPVQPAPQIVEKVVTQVVEKQVEKAVVATQIVERTVERQVVATPAPAPKSAGKKVLHVTSASPGDNPTLDPGLGQDTRAIQWIDMTSVGLTHLNVEDTSLQPGMAEKWDVSPDGKTYTFHLRSDVPWVKWDNQQQAVIKVQTCPDKDGKTADRMVTAQDFEYGILRALKPETASPYAYVLGFVVKGANEYNSGTITDTKQVGVKALDDKTLQVEFLQPAVYNPNILGLWTAHAVPSWMIDGDDCNQARKDRWTETGFFQGYGPYTLKEWIHDDQLTIVKNPFWPGSPAIPVAKIDEINERFLDLPGSLSEYEADNLDATQVGSAEMDRVQGDPKLSKELSTSPLPCTMYLGYNTKAPVVDDVRVRQALSLAIDRQSLVDNVLKGGNKPAQWFCRPGLVGCPDPKDYPDLGVKFDVAQAKSTLAGYLDEKKTTADKLPLSLLIFVNADGKRVAEAVQQMWKQTLGLDVPIEAQEWKVFLDTVQDPKKTPQLYYLGWCLDYPDANNFDRDVVAFGGNNNPKAGGGFNWKNDKYEDLVKQAALEPDPKKRVQMYADAEKILTWEDAIMAPLTWNQIVRLTQPYVKTTYSSTAEQEYNKWDIDMSQAK